jgi:SAM-dependent methyltransferase
VGVSATTADFLVEARDRGVRFDRTLTIGRQTLFAGPLALRRHGLPWPRRPWVLDPLLETLGAREVVALDASGYEGADRIHDLNDPVPADLRDRFDVVFDGGSLEHVFDVPQALRSYMGMVKPGGHLIVQTVADGHCGHGFYQFSPELFYRALSDASGYHVERLQLAVEEVDVVDVAGIRVPVTRGRGRRFDVADPAVVGERVEPRARSGASLLVQARRVRATDPLAVAPQQSDYERAWAAATPAPGPLRALFRRAASPRAMTIVTLDVLPRLVAPLARIRSARRRSLKNRRLFRPVR